MSWLSLVNKMLLKVLKKPPTKALPTPDLPLRDRWK
jgi:hypothetical protein